MIPSVRTNSGLAVRSLREVMRQFPYALSLAINDTAEQFQEVERRHLLDVFQARRPKWVRDNVKIRRGDFAHPKRGLRAIVRMEAPGKSADRTDVLAKFEDGGTKTPRDGSRLAVPAEAKRTPRGIIGKRGRPKSFDFTPMGGKTRSARHVYQGNRRTWMLRNPDGTGGIYQRTGKRATKKRRGEGRRLASDIHSRKSRDLNLRTLFRFTPDASIDRRLDFEETARRVVRARFSDNFEKALEKALKGGADRKTARRMARADTRRR